MRLRNDNVEMHVVELVGFIGILVLCAVQLLSSFKTAFGIVPFVPASGDHHPKVDHDAPTILTANTLLSDGGDGDESEYDENLYESTTSTNFGQEDWFHQSSWKNRMESNCFHVENFCHSTHQWFYDTRSRRYYSDQDGSSDNPPPKIPHQPNLVMRFLQPLNDPSVTYHQALNYPENITLDGFTPIQERFHYSSMSCTYSPIINHLSLHSLDNDRLGDFYVRTLMGLLGIADSIAGKPPFRSTTTTTSTPTTTTTKLSKSEEEQTLVEKKLEDLFYRQTQIYIHFQLHGKNPQPDILDSQRLFTDMIVSNPLLNFRTLLDHGGCRCLKRLIFCGYQRSKAVPVAAVRQPERRQQQGATTKSKQDTATAAATTTTVTLPVFEPAAHMGTSSMSKARSGHQSQIVRDALRHGMIDQHHSLQYEINQTRLSFLKYHNVVSQSVNLDDPSSQQALQEWTIIGLAQRIKRRKWQHLAGLEARCVDEQKVNKILCVTITMEDAYWTTPQQQLLAHAALDGFIGIHGAQLTDAVWMPPHKLVVELLPYIPPETQPYGGNEVQHAHKPTPLGVIYSGTDLNHVGYPLDLSSVQGLYCGEELYSKECFAKPSHRWEVRDFLLSWEILDDILTKFVVQRPTTCTEFVERAGDDYVLYNVNCVDVSGNSSSTKTETVVHHYYREQDRIAKKHAAAAEAPAVEPRH
jgi:hypothetical protein